MYYIFGFTLKTVIRSLKESVTSKKINQSKILSTKKFQFSNMLNQIKRYESVTGTSTTINKIDKDFKTLIRMSSKKKKTSYTKHKELLSI